MGYTIVSYSTRCKIMDKYFYLVVAATLPTSWGNANDHNICVHFGEYF